MSPETPKNQQLSFLEHCILTSLFHQNAGQEMPSRWLSLF